MESRTFKSQNVSLFKWCLGDRSDVQLVGGNSQWKPHKNKSVRFQHDSRTFWAKLKTISTTPAPHMNRIYWGWRWSSTYIMALYTYIDMFIYIYCHIDICCEVIIWAKFGLFERYYLGQVRVDIWAKVICGFKRFLHIQLAFCVFYPVISQFCKMAFFKHCVPKLISFQIYLFWFWVSF